MEKANDIALIEIVQRGIGKRELRYGSMRVLRIFFGWPSWLIGMIAIAFGAMMAGLALIRPERIAAVDAWHALLWAGLAMLGVTLVMVALAIAVPYQFDTDMPGVESERKCLHCGYSLEPGKMFPRCGGCGSWFPMDGLTYIGRIMSRFATAINVIIMVATGIILLAK